MAVLATVRETGIRGIFKKFSKSTKNVESRGSRRGRSIQRSLDVLESRVLLSTTPTFSTVYNFDNSTSGVAPVILVSDSAGNVYGATSQGPHEIFEIAAGTNTLVVLHTFSGAEGVGSTPSLVVDSSGNIYGTTVTGGDNNQGSVFEISAGTHVFTTLKSFSTTVIGQSGVNPTLTIGSNGMLYGTTQFDGTNNAGTVFKINPNLVNNFTLLATFTSSMGTASDITIDSNNNLYIATNSGGSNSTGEIFKLASGSSTLNGLVSFPVGIGTTSLTLNSGILYGVSSTGGVNGDGSIFSLTLSNNTFNTLYSFTNGADGETPTGSLVVDSAGNIYGVAVSGGSGSGTLFEYSAGTVTAVETFSGTNGATPLGGLTVDSAGTLFGSTLFGGTNNVGSIFSLTPATPAVATHLVVTTQPTATMTGALGTITVAVEDADGNVVTTANGKVTISIMSGSGSLTGTLNFNAVNGIATFSNLSIAKAGTFTLKAVSSGLTTATTNSFTLAAAPTVATKLVVTTQPVTTAAGAIVNAVVVEVTDSKGHVITTDASTVSFTVTSKNGTLSSGTTDVVAVNGVATFSDLVFDTLGTYTLSFTDGALKTVKSKTLKITADASTAHLVITQQPESSLVVGQKTKTALLLTLQDQFGNIVTGTKTKAVLTATSSPANAVIKGTTSFSISSGKATVKGLSFSEAGSYTLTVTESGLVDSANVPVTFTETITPGTSTLVAPKPAKQYAAGKTVKLTTQLKSTAASTIPYTGTATVTDSNNIVVGTAVVTTSGKITITFTDLQAGTSTLTLSYTGDDNHTDVTTTAFTLVVV